MSDIHQSPLDDDRAASNPIGGSSGSTWDEPTTPSGSQSYSYGTPAASAASGPAFGASDPGFGRPPETPVSPNTPAASGGGLGSNRNCLMLGIGGGILAICLVCLALGALGALGSVLGTNTASDEPGIDLIEPDETDTGEETDIEDILQGGDGSEEPVEETTTSVMVLEVGDCFNDPQLNAEGFVEELAVVDCNDPHDREIFESLQFPEGDGSFPGDEGFDEFSEEGCLAAFDPYVGLAYAESVFVVSTLEPTQDSWDSGDREILCILYEPDAKTTGSAQDSAR